VHPDRTAVSLTQAHKALIRERNALDIAPGLTRYLDIVDPLPADSL